MDSTGLPRVRENRAQSLAHVRDGSAQVNLPTFSDRS